MIRLGFSQVEGVLNPQTIDIILFRSIQAVNLDDASPVS